MKIDTINKTIRIEKSVTVAEFADEMKRHLPESEWKDYVIDIHPAVYMKYQYPFEETITTFN